MIDNIGDNDDDDNDENHENYFDEDKDDDGNDKDVLAGPGERKRCATDRGSRTS